MTADCFHDQAGGSPAASHFLLLRQKKVTKEKVTRSLGPYAALRATCGARSKRGLARTRFAQTIASPDPLASALLSPARTGWDRTASSRTPQVRAMARTCFGIGFWYRPFGMPRSGWAEQRRRGRIKNFRCPKAAQQTSF